MIIILFSKLYSHIRPKRFKYKLNQVITSVFFSVQINEKKALLEKSSRVLGMKNYQKFFTGGIVFKKQN